MVLINQHEKQKIGNNPMPSLFHALTETAILKRPNLITTLTVNAILRHN